MKVEIDAIRIGERVRRDAREITALVESLRDVGQIQPVAVDEAMNLLDGFRRIKAAECLDWTEVEVHVVRDLDDYLRLRAQRDANVCRLAFTPSEAVALGKLLEPFERKAAKERSGHRTDLEPSGNLPEGWNGDSRERVAEAVGMSGKTYEKAKAVVDSGNRKLIQQMDDKGKVDPAFKELRSRSRGATLKAGRVAVSPLMRRHIRQMKQRNAEARELEKIAKPCAEAFREVERQIMIARDTAFEETTLFSLQRAVARLWNLVDGE